MPKKEKTEFKKYLISVVLPSYNRDWVIAQAIKSVMGQSYENWELIIVDDGSTDGTEDLVRWFKSKEKRIRSVHRKKNRGIGFSRHEGNHLAKGDIIAVMDSDDIMLGDRLKLINDTFNTCGVDIMYTDYYRGDMIGTPKFRVDCEKFSDRVLDNRQLIPHLTTAYWRQLAIDTSYQEDAKINDDWFFFVDVYNAGYRFLHVSEATMIERPMGSGVSIQSRELYDKHFKEYKINPELRKKNEKRNT